MPSGADSFLEGSRSRGDNVASSDEDADVHIPEMKEQDTATAAECLRVFVGSTHVEVTNIRLFSLDELALESLTACTHLSLRKNLIHELRSLPEELAGRLEQLDLFDNKIRKLRDFFTSAMVASLSGTGKAVKQVRPSAFASLSVLDLSYNQIKRIRGLETLGPTLRELYLVENRIKVVEGLETLTQLELLELGGNRIRDVGDGLRTLRKLRFLWLGKNSIAKLGSSLHNLENLEVLSLQANRLTAIAPGDFPEGAHPRLGELYLSENGIRTIENLPVHSLRLLDFSFDPIEFINEAVINPQNMPLLEEFWLTDGKVNRWEEVDKLQDFKDTLRTVYLERNPIEQDRRYRDKVYLSLPFVTQIDSWPVVNKGNLEADRAIQRRDPRV